MSHAVAPRHTSGVARPRARLARETRHRRRRLEHARRLLEAFETSNRYQAELKGTALALISFMAKYWCGPEHATDFQRWWRVVARYTGVLVSRKLDGPGTRKRLNRLLNQNQSRPTDS